jgi:hypothetical protein
MSLNTSASTPSAITVAATLLLECVYAPAFLPSRFLADTLLKVIFSPIVAVRSVSRASTVCPLTSRANASSAEKISLSVLSRASLIASTPSLNLSFEATKSVSELTSNTTALLSFEAAIETPSAATLPAFLAAFAIPFSLSHCTAASMSSFVASSAFLTSIIPAPVISLSSLILAKSAIMFLLFLNSS